MKLINKMAVLDKGHVGLFACAINQRDLSDIQTEYFKGIASPKLLDLPTAVLDIKCPLFVQLFLSEYDLSITSSRGASKTEAFIPSVAEIDSPDLKTSEDIQKNIDATIAALLINPLAYQHDKCDTFISQVVSPISMYNQLMVSGRLSEWVKVFTRKGCPKAINQYQIAIQAALKGEWIHLDEYVKKSK